MTAFVPLLDIDRVLAMLSRISVFGGLSDKHLYEVFRLLGKATFAKGSFIFEAGDAPGYIYIIESGSVELFIPGRDVVVDKARLGPGECFGEASFIGISAHTASAYCLEPCEIIGLDRRAFLELQHTDLELFALLMLNLARELSRRLHKTDQLLLHYLQRQARS